MELFLFILAQADLAPSAIGGIVNAGIAAILLAIAVVYFAVKERKREASDKEREKEEVERFRAMIIALEQNTQAMKELRDSDTAMAETMKGVAKTVDRNAGIMEQCLVALRDE